MSHNMLFAAVIATGIADEFAELQPRLEKLSQRIQQVMLTFLANPVTPSATHQFERLLESLLRDMGREIAEFVYNRLEPSDPERMPRRIEFDGQAYRRRERTPRRGGVATVFGVITLLRFLYEPLRTDDTQGERIPSIHPLEWDLGIVAGRATPALAERAGELAAGHTQSETLRQLQRFYAVGWTVSVLRKVVAAVSAGIGAALHDAQKARLLAWLRQADGSRGRRKIVFAAGRDGIMLPIQGESHYKEGAVGTLAVFDRRGRRLGTVYLGQMPEAYQQTLSENLTRLITDVLAEWGGPAPRLVYITDAGSHPTQYFQDVLSSMDDPRRPGRQLKWTWIVDFYHASEYVWKLGRALFGETAMGRSWSRRMLHRLKHEANAVYGLLHSAARFRADGDLSENRQEEYRKAYNYLKNHGSHMDYLTYRRQGLPIGSGITEAACKTVFTQRFKASGMSWKCESGQQVLVLRLTLLSGVWRQTVRDWLKSRRTLNYINQPANRTRMFNIAA
jgi:hypothetical protein